MSKTSYWYCPNCKEEIDPANVTFQELHNACGHAVEWIEGIEPDRLTEICAAEREGRCVVLPCKVGDTVYKLTSDALSGIEETKINRIVIKKNKITFNADCINDDWGRAAWDIRVCDFGKTAFLTREAAEAALRKEQSDEHAEND